MGVSILTTKGNVGSVVEYFGPGVATLSVPQRATITNMGAELGVTTSVFPSDEMTRAWLRRQNRESVFTPLAADADAEYDRVITIDLAQIVPLAACPSSPDQVKPVAELAGIEVDQVLIGSCTNGGYRDLAMAAMALRGRRISPGVTLGISPEAVPFWRCWPATDFWPIWSPRAPVSSKWAAVPASGRGRVQPTARSA